MKNLDMNLIKDIGISVLLVLAIIIILLTAFYDKLAINKTVSTPQEYQVQEEVLEEVNKENEEQETDIITTYSITGSKLKSYEGTGKSDYDKDKEDPFERYTYIESEESNNTTNSSGKNESNNEPKSIK